MKCPLIKKVVFQELPTINLVEGDCLKGECAWWDDQDKRCYLCTIGGCLKAHLGWIGDLVRKMPHEVQFRK